LLDRRHVGIECNQEYVDIARSRLEMAKSQIKLPF